MQLEKLVSVLVSLPRRVLVSQTFRALESFSVFVRLMYRGTDPPWL